MARTDRTAPAALDPSADIRPETLRSGGRGPQDTNLLTEKTLENVPASSTASRRPALPTPNRLFIHAEALSQFALGDPKPEPFGSQALRRRTLG